MLRKLGAVLLMVGLSLPYGCDVRPITDVWGAGAKEALFIGIPVLLLIAYALHAFLPAIARFHERNGPMLHGLLRAVYFAIVGGYLWTVADDSEGWPALIGSVAVTGALLLWQQGRGTKAQRLPLLLLTAAGVPVVLYFADVVLGGDGLQIGGWVLTAGYAVAVVAEVLALRGAPPIQHGG